MRAQSGRDVAPPCLCVDKKRTGLPRAEQLSNGYVLGNGEAVDQIDALILMDNSDTINYLVYGSVNLLTANRHHAGDLDFTRKRAKHRAFPGTVGADEGHELSRLD